MKPHERITSFKEATELALSESGGQVAHFFLSFGLTAQGAPGRYNLQIISRSFEILLALTRLARSGTARPIAVLQWELAVQLAELIEAEALKTPPITPEQMDTLQIVTPDLFKEGAVAEPALAVKRILHPETPTMEALRNYFETHELTAENLVQQLNRACLDATFFQPFDRLVQLRPFYREQLPPELGREDRVLPTPAEYPQGLRKGHAIRVGRLLLSEILGPSVVPRLPYLSSWGTFADPLKELLRTQSPPEWIFVHAHPWHGLRVRDQILDFGAERKWNLSPERVISIHNLEYRPDDWPEDPTNAQTWVQTFGQWCRYEAFRATVRK